MINICKPRRVPFGALLAAAVGGLLLLQAALPGCSQQAQAHSPETVHLNPTPLDEIAFSINYRLSLVEHSSDSFLLKMFQRRYSELMLAHLAKTLPHTFDYSKLSITVWIDKDGKVSATHCYSRGGTSVSGNYRYAPGVTSCHSVDLDGLHGWRHPANREMVYTVLQEAKNAKLPALPSWWKWYSVAMPVELDSIAGELSPVAAAPR